MAIGYEQVLCPDALWAIVEPLLPRAGGGFSEQRDAIHGTVGGPFGGWVE